MKGHRRFLIISAGSMIGFAALGVPGFCSMAQDGTGYQDTYAEVEMLRAENRKLALALADATEKLLELREKGGASGSCDAELENVRGQNLSLRETIKAQNEVLSTADNAAKTVDELRKAQAQIVGLKETIKQLQAQNDHMSSAGNLGGTATAQIIAAQNQIAQLDAALKKEQQISAAFRAEIKKNEVEMVGLKKGICKDAPPEKVSKEDADLQDQITALKLENQELRARIDLLAEKTEKKP